MPGSNCAIVNCATQSAKCRGISFFLIRQRKPANKGWEQDLVRAVNRCDPYFNIERAKICSRHFTPDCILTSAKGQHSLIPGSLPTLWMPEKGIEMPKPTPRKPPEKKPRKTLASRRKPVDSPSSSNSLPTRQTKNQTATGQGFGVKGKGKRVLMLPAKVKRLQKNEPKGRLKRQEKKGPQGRLKIQEKNEPKEKLRGQEKNRPDEKLKRQLKNGPKERLKRQEKNGPEEKLKRQLKNEPREKLKRQEKNGPEEKLRGQDKCGSEKKLKSQHTSKRRSKAKRKSKSGSHQPLQAEDQQEWGSGFTHSPAYQHWKSLGAQQGLCEDSDIACFLLKYYEHTSRVLPSDLGGVCKTCGTPLSISCTRCDWTICAQATPTSGRDLTQNEGDDDCTEDDHDPEVKTSWHLGDKIAQAEGEREATGEASEPEDLCEPQDIELEWDTDAYGYEEFQETAEEDTVHHSSDTVHGFHATVKAEKDNSTEDSLDDKSGSLNDVHEQMKCEKVEVSQKAPEDEDYSESTYFDKNIGEDETISVHEETQLMESTEEPNRAQEGGDDDNTVNEHQEKLNTEQDAATVNEHMTKTDGVENVYMQFRCDEEEKEKREAKKENQSFQAIQGGSSQDNSEVCFLVVMNKRALQSVRLEESEAEVCAQGDGEEMAPNFHDMESSVLSSQHSVKKEKIAKRGPVKKSHKEHKKAPHLDSESAADHKIERTEKKQMIGEKKGPSFEDPGASWVNVVHPPESKSILKQWGESNSQMGLRVQGDKQSSFLNNIQNHSASLPSIGDKAKRSLLSVLMEPFQCDVCDKQFESYDGFKLHKKSHLGEQFVCEVCGKSFPKASSVKNHVRHVHNDQKPVQCDICGRTVKTDGYLRQHRKTCSNPDRYFCETCGKGFKWKWALNQHRRSHSGQNKRDVKKRIVSNKMKLQGQKEARNKSIVSDKTVTINVKYVACEPVPNKDSQHQHKKADANQTACICDICGKTFSKRSSLRSHYIIHFRNFECDICGEAFCSQSKVLLHKIKHSDNRPYVCETCGSAYKRLDNLNKHKKQIHEGRKPYSCTVCSKSFFRRYVMRNHMVKLHIQSGTGRKRVRRPGPHVCEQCGKKFTDYNNCMRHRKIHTGRKPYQCDVCHKSFRLSYSMKIHKRIHLGIKPFECDICLKTFREKGTMIKHKKIHMRKTLK